MYRSFYRLLSLFSIIAVVIFSVIAITNYHQQMFSGSNGKISVIKANLKLKDDIETIANNYNVVIAKQIMVKSTDGKSENQPTFQVFGEGSIPDNFTLQSSKKLLESSPDDVLYFIFGEGLSDQKLADLLNEKGNQVFIYRPVWQLIGINALMTPSISLGLFLILLALASLIFAEKVSALKQSGIERLAGMSIGKIAFKGTIPLLLFELICGVIFSLVGYIYLIVNQLSGVLYAQIIIITVTIWLLLICIISFMAMFIMYLVLKSQSIQKVIKGYAPVKLLTAVIVFVQLLSIIFLVLSLETVLNSKKEIISLNQAEIEWRKVPTWFSPKFMGGASTRGLDGEKFFNFLEEAQKKENFIIAADNLNYSQEDNILPSKESNSNVIFVSPNFLIEQNIVSDLTGSQFLEKTAWILIPKSKEKQKKQVEKSWKNELIQNWDKDGKPIENHDLTIKSATYDDSHPIFTYRILGANLNNRVYSNSPVLLVVDLKTYANTETFTAYFTSWLSQQKLIFSAPQVTTTLIEKYGLQNNIGSYTNGLYSVQHAISIEKQNQMYLGVASAVAVGTSLILLSILNSIYLHQNRRKFVIQKLAGMSNILIHWKYALILAITMGAVSVLIIVLRLNIWLELVPFLMLVIVTGLFCLQLSKSNHNLLSNLKGE